MINDTFWMDQFQQAKKEAVKLHEENKRLRKALEEIRGITGIGYDSEYRQAVEIASQVLEPAKGEDTQ